MCAIRLTEYNLLRSSDESGCLHNNMHVQARVYSAYVFVVRVGVVGVVGVVGCETPECLLISSNSLNTLLANAIASGVNG